MGGGYTKDGHALGMIPSLLDPAIFEPEGGPEEIQSLPALYDLRIGNKLTPVKNQGSCGACWPSPLSGSGIVPETRRRVGLLGAELD